MHDARSGFAADTAEIRNVMQQGVHERSGRVASTRMHHQASRLVEHRQVSILVQNIER